MKTQLLFLKIIISLLREFDFQQTLRLVSITLTSSTLYTIITHVNIRYKIRNLLTKENVAFKMQRLVANVLLFNKILVFYTIVNLIKSLTQELSNLRYYSKLTNKNKMLRQFDRSKCYTMIVIIVLSFKLNKQNVDLIVYVSYLFSLLNYAQESE